MLSKQKSSPQAELGDLVDSGGEKEVYIESIGKTVTIKKILLGDMGRIVKKAGEDPFENLKFMLFVGLVKPRLSLQQIEKMKAGVANEIGTAIADYSGLTKEAIERARNLSKVTMDTQSGE